ncbi:OmpP1/FadL family transporter [Maribacter hydrothermalis]|uniref:Aromatic hydrocarbon degradation protein n=1 Tax=Maribacter hydrothermalis TaxID=1836467 RepID=A0A1B7Z164_9FLAO|nr:outer membrane protein transport protein [Maribacter hydrothermalis]APQ18116.1 aromatic hydrocarbon degradation protein [Maribacter hydrothermalis]OBR36462.1 aromatic hydrocarbon degradation protein [Maribacter hydrothermalis]
MKRYIIFIVLAVCAVGNAQNINEVLRYSSENLQGTARFQAMGGAFGALGGDLSSLNVNPAGSAVFNNSLFTVSGTTFNANNQSSYFGTSRDTKNNTVDLNQIGGAFVFKNTDSNSDWQKFTLAFNYDVVTNFDNKYTISGNSTQGVDGYFLSYAQGTPFGSILLQDGEYLEEAYLDIGSAQGFSDQQTFLGYYGGIIDPIAQDDNNTDYTSNTTYNTVNQEFLRRTTGYNSKFTLNMGSQFKENIYMGASLNFHNVLYTKYDQLTESGYDPTSEIQRSTYDNYLRTDGNGFSFSLGAIAKLNEIVRVGGSYQSPTWYRFEDEFSQRINSDLADDEINFIDFNIVNLFERYTVKTPGKLTGSIAVIFAKDGLLSFDYGYQDFSNAELRPTGDPSFQTVNNQISNTLGAVSTFRLGGEYRIKQISLRAGYRFEQSPYTNGNTIGDLNALSGGIGYNFGGSRLDFALSHSQQDISEQLFDAGFTTPAFVNRKNTNATLSYTINF